MGSFLSLPILILAAVIQVTIMPRINILGGRPDLVFLLVMAWSLNTSLEQGIIWAFVGGISSDLLSAAPLGTSIVGMIILVFIIHGAREQIYRVGLFTLIWVVVLGTFFHRIVIILILIFAGFSPAFAERLGYGVVIQQITSFVFPTMIYNLVVMLPIYSFVRRIQKQIQNRHIFVR